MTTTPRRRVLRSPAPVAIDPREDARMQRRRAELIKARASLKRWLSRLKRATNTVTDLYQRINRLESNLGVGI
jgi:hypothetical protein